MDARQVRCSECLSATLLVYTAMALVQGLDAKAVGTRGSSPSAMLG